MILPALGPDEVAQSGEAQVHEYRQNSLVSFFEVFQELADDFIAVEGLSLSYFRGWDKGRDYRELLQTSLDKDVLRGYTQSGPHRADLRITIHGQSAADLLSRGQQKLLVCALRIAQGLVFSRITGRVPIYLLDDLPAELDKSHRQLLAKWLEEIACQTFVTGVERGVLLETWEAYPETDKQVFHVEQGCVTATE